MAAPIVTTRILRRFLSSGVHSRAERVLQRVHPADLGPLLADGRWVVAPDLPGFGHSQRRVSDYSIASHADYALDLLDRLSVTEVDLVGFSIMTPQVPAALEATRELKQRRPDLPVMLGGAHISATIDDVFHDIPTLLTNAFA